MQLMQAQRAATAGATAAQQAMHQLQVIYYCIFVAIAIFAVYRLLQHLLF